MPLSSQTVAGQSLPYSVEEKWENAASTVCLQQRKTHSKVAEFYISSALRCSAPRSVFCAAAFVYR